MEPNPKNHFRLLDELRCTRDSISGTHEFKHRHEMLRGQPNHSIAISEKARARACSAYGAVEHEV